jgi:hypothetical protein
MVIACLTLAQDRRHDKILFLFLVKKADTITLRGVRIVDGTLKTRRGCINEAIRYEISDVFGRVIFQGGLPPPDILHYDGEMEADGGVLSGGRVVLDSVEFVVRLPYTQDYAHAEFFTARGTGMSRGDARGVVRLGGFDIPRKESGQ